MTNSLARAMYQTSNEAQPDRLLGDDLNAARYPQSYSLHPGATRLRGGIRPRRILAHPGRMATTGLLRDWGWHEGSLFTAVALVFDSNV